MRGPHVERALADLGSPPSLFIGQARLGIELFAGEVVDPEKVARSLRSMPTEAALAAAELGLIDLGSMHSPRENPLSSEDIERLLGPLLAKPGGFETFCERLGHHLWERGIAIKNMGASTQRFLRESLPAIEKIKEGAQSGVKNKEETLKALRTMQTNLVGFADSANASLTSTDQKKGGQEGSLTRFDYAALNAQHEAISGAIRSLESAIISEQPKKLHRWLTRNPLFAAPKQGAESLTSDKATRINQLVELGIIQHVSGREGQTFCAFGEGAITKKLFERALSQPIRERIGREICDELSRKYEGHLRGLVVTDSPEDQCFGDLRDAVRLHRISQRAGVPPAAIQLAIRYYRELGFLTTDGERRGYLLSAEGIQSKLSVRTSEPRLPAGDAKPTNPTLLDLVRRAQRAKAARQVPHFEIKGHPHVRWINGLKVPEDTLDVGLVEYAKNQPRARLTGISDLSALPPEFDRANTQRIYLTAEDASADPETAARKEQEARFALAVNEARDIGAHFIAQGPTDWRSAKTPAHQQVMREKYEGSTRPSEAQVRAHTAPLEQQRNMDQQRYALQIEEWQKFIFYIGQRLELKLGRKLHESNVIQEAIGVNLNELEIIKEIAQMMRGGGVTREQGAPSLPRGLRQDIEARFSDYLRFVRAETPDFLDRVKRVVFPEAERHLGGKSDHDLRAAEGGHFTFTDRLGARYEIEFVGSRAINPRKGPLGRPIPLRNYIQAITERAHGANHPHLCVVPSGELGATMRHGTWFVSPGTVSDGGPVGFIDVKGGVHNGEVTQAISVQLVTPRILQRLEENRQRNLPPSKHRIFFSSDQHIGSPAMRPDALLSGLLEAVISGADTIVLNGDLLDGANHTTLLHESQVLAHPLMGIDKQQEMVCRLLDPVLDLIKARAEKDPSYKVPTFVLLPGNHETNTDRPGLQGTSFTRPIAEHIRSFLRGWRNTAFADTRVVSPQLYTEVDGSAVRYPMVHLDLRDSVGFCIEATHYNGRAGGGGPFGAAAKGTGTYLIAMNRPEVDITVVGHTHTGEVFANAVGQTVLVIPTATGATPHGVHVGFRDGGEVKKRPSGAFLNLSSTEPPIYDFPTVGSLTQKVDEHMRTLHKHGILSHYSSPDEYLTDMRRRISSGRTFNPTDLRDQL